MTFEWWVKNDDPTHVSTREYVLNHGLAWQYRPATAEEAQAIEDALEAQSIEDQYESADGGKQSNYES